VNVKRVFFTIFIIGALSCTFNGVNGVIEVIEVIEVTAVICIKLQLFLF